MKIYDISQEVFTCAVFPGDVPPQRKVLETIEGGSICNLTGLSMCAHNGTHVDAPYHFYKDGKTIDQLDLQKVVGKCFVCHFHGPLTGDKAKSIVRRAKITDPESVKRILIGGDMYVTLEAAKVFAEEGIWLIGNESQTVGPLEAPAEVHYELLKAEVVLLEGIRLADVLDGVYMLNAAPLNLGQADGAPCRAILIDEEPEISPEKIDMPAMMGAVPQADHPGSMPLPGLMAMDMPLSGMMGMMQPSATDDPETEVELVECPACHTKVRKGAFCPECGSILNK